MAHCSGRFSGTGLAGYRHLLFEAAHQNGARVKRQVLFVSGRRRRRDDE